MARKIRFSEDLDGPSNFQTAVDDLSIIVVSCLGSSQAASDCFDELDNLINDPGGTRLVLIGDDDDASQARATLRNLPNGAVVKDDSICVVVTHDQKIQGSVSPPKGSLAAFVLWGKAIEHRDGGAA